MIKVLTAKNLSQVPFINHGFFGRKGGFSQGVFESLNVGINRGDDEKAVFNNRKKIANLLGQETLIIPQQIHSNKVCLIATKDQEIPSCDALITKEPEILIGVNTADCVPILLCDTETRYIAAIHSGWRGAIAGIIEETLKALQELGCRALRAALGPCIHQAYFEVGQEVLEKLTKKERDQYVKGNHFHLPLFVQDKLISYGVEEVELIDVDTFSNNEEYFSYRRYLNSGFSQKCGVQFSGIVIKE